MTIVRYDMTNQNYSCNTKTMIENLRYPHLTEKIEVHYPLTFPCKDIYERVNTALEGLTVQDHLEGSPDSLGISKMMKTMMMTEMMTKEVMTNLSTSSPPTY